jgi:cytochrome c biogenesis protein
MRLALILIAIIVALAIIATLIPQGRDTSYYEQEYPAGIVTIIRFLHLDVFYTSVIFLVPCALFFINLALCTFNRIFTRFRNHAPLRIGPDLIHIGILCIMIFGILSFFLHREGYAELREQESLTLPNGKEVILTAFEFFTYEDGRPKDWISHVKVLDTDGAVKEDRIEVNHPLKVDSYRIFQNSYRYIPAVTLKASSGEFYQLDPGDAAHHNSHVYAFTGFEYNQDGSVVVHIERLDIKPIERWILAQGDRFGELTVDEVIVFASSGLQVVQDPMEISILIAFAILFTGLCIAFIQKKGDLKK